MAKKPRGKNARIVEDEQIAGHEIPVEVGEHRMIDRALASKHQQPRSAALRRWMLCNQRIRQFEIEIRNIHSVYA